MELEEREGTRRFWGSEVDIEIYPCDETEPATVMVLTSGDLRWGGGDILGTEEEFLFSMCPG